MNDGLELRVGQHPQQVVQNEEQLGRQHITVLYLERAMKNSEVGDKSFVTETTLHIWYLTNPVKGRIVLCVSERCECVPGWWWDVRGCCRGPGHHSQWRPPRFVDSASWFLWMSKPNGNKSKTIKTKKHKFPTFIWNYYCYWWGMGKICF